MTLERIDEILRNKGYPSRQELQGFPLGELLLTLDSSAWTSNGRAVELYEKENPNSRDLGKDEQDLSVPELEERLREQERILHNERITEVYRHHIVYIVKASVLLTTNAYSRILEQSDVWSNEPFASFGQFLQSKNRESLLGPADGYFRKFIRFSALYHDIGKSINRERHGILGRHLLETLSDKDTAELRNLLRFQGNDFFPLFIELIGHHDLFGMLCTGEASRPVLLDIMRMKDPPGFSDVRRRLTSLTSIPRSRPRAWPWTKGFFGPFSKTGSSWSIASRMKNSAIRCFSRRVLRKRFCSTLSRGNTLPKESGGC
jgi:hypothetical protein